MLILPIDSPNTDGVQAVRITIVVTIIFEEPAISSSKNENRAKPLATFFDSINNSVGDQLIWSLDVPTVVFGAPGARIDMILLVAVIDSKSFVNIGHRGAQNSDT